MQSSEEAAQVTEEPTGEPASQESCLTCHALEASAIEGVHGAIGCVSCHGGNPEEPSLVMSHVGLELEPGALDTVGSTCGTCHPEEVRRVEGSIMTTNRGLIAVNRWAFGELEEPNGDQTMAELLADREPTPAEDHTRRLCAGCHLGSRKANRDDAITVDGSGCSSCHLEAQDGHPAIAPIPSNERCLGCHSRSARLSLAYEGLAEMKAGEEACEAPVTLHDGRPGCSLEADLHHEAGLECVDCHLHTELMGSGEAHQHKEQALEVSCESCHAIEESQTVAVEEITDPITLRILAMRGAGGEPGERIALGSGGTPIWNLRLGENGWSLRGKRSGEDHFVAQVPSDPNHQLRGHERLSCAICHSGWAPRCGDCHTEYQPESEQWDFGRARVASGRWVESSHRFDWGAPTMAISHDSVVPAAPGMVMELDATAAGGESFERRLFSAFDPHTTTSSGRSCASCHESSQALGYGDGILHLDGPLPRFTGEQEWIAPLEVGEGTREWVRSLNRDEQLRVLRVGSCTPCHSDPTSAIYGDFAHSLANIPPNCEGEAPSWGPATP